MPTDRAPGEGLWPLDVAEVPYSVRAAAEGVVRVRSLVRFEVTLHATKDAAARARATLGALAKRFLPEGGVIWPVLSDRATLDAICNDVARAAQPGFHEICRAYRLSRDRDVFVTEPLGTGATGCAIADRDGLTRVITNYHVAREAIERLGRWGGDHEPRPEPSRDVWIAPDEGVWTRGVWLEANASEEEWLAGRDWAVLLARLNSNRRPLPLRLEPPLVGDKVWVLGFPARTSRQPVSYPEADGSLRVAVGTIAHVEYGLIVSNADGAPGSSGSPVLDEAGRVVGIYRDSTHRDGEFDMRVGAYGGNALITRVTCLPAWLHDP